MEYPTLILILYQLYYLKEIKNIRNIIILNYNCRNLTIYNKHTINIDLNTIIIQIINILGIYLRVII